MASGEPRQKLAALRDDTVAVFPAFATARVLVLLALVLMQVIADELGVERPVEVDQGLLAWDGQWYESIAADGYGGTPLEGVRFFPLLPMLGAAVSWLSPLGAGIAVVVVANVAGLGTLVALRRLVMAEGRSSQEADRAVWLLSMFPSAFVLAWGYSESLMLLAVIAGFAAARRGSWVAAAGWGVLAGLSRPLGALLAIPILIEVIAARRSASSTSGGASLRQAVALVSAPGAALAFVLWASVRFDDFLVPLTIQSDLRGDTTNPLVRVGEGIGDMFGAERLGDGLHIPFALAFIALAVIALRSWPLSYGAFAVACLLVALGAENLNSLERYALNAFPLVLALGSVADDERVRLPVLSMSAASMVALCALAWSGAYVP